MSELANAIKVAIQATKESAKSGPISHAALLDNVAERLGFGSFRALVASQKEKSPGNSEESRENANANVELKDITPFTAHFFCSDDMTQSVMVDVDGEILERMSELAKGAKKLKTTIEHDDWQEYHLSGRTSLATRLMVDKKGMISATAEIFDKHSSMTVGVYGELELSTLIQIAKTEQSQAATEYIWNATTRDLYILNDIIEPDSWIDTEPTEMRDLLEQHQQL